MIALLLTIVALAASARAVQVKRSLDLCTICSSVVGEAAALAAQGRTDSDIQAALDADVCPHFGAYQAECDGIVSEFLPTVLAAVGKQSPVTVCRKLALCASPALQQLEQQVALAVAQPQPQQSEGGFCPECKAIVAFVESYLTSNSTEMKVEHEVDKVCALLGGLATPCKAFVHDELPEIIKRLEAHETPAQVCTKLNVCHNSTVALTALAALVPSRGAPAPGAGFCSTCEAAVGFAEGWLAENATEQELQTYLDDFCKLTPYASQCTTLVNAYLPQVIHYLELKENATTICHQIGACATANEFAALLGKRLERALVALQSDGFCGLCQDAVGFAESYLRSNATVAEVGAFLDEVCNMFPQYQSECHAAVQQYLPALINYIEKNENPQTVCTDVGVCSSETRVLLPPPIALAPVAVDAPAAPQSEFCDICKAMVSFVESYLEQNATVLDIEHRLEDLCKLTGPYATECKNLVDVYTPQLIHYVEQKETPQHACEQVHACAAPSAALRTTLLPLLELQRPAAAAAAAVPALGDSSTHCALCKTLASYLYVFVEHNETQAKIEHELDQLCKVAGSFEMQCDGLIHQFLPSMIQWVEQKETPEKICEHIHLCDAPSAAPALELKAPAASSEGCSICELVVSVGDHYAATNETVQFVEQKLGALCEVAPANYRAPCKALVASYTPQLDGWFIGKTKHLCVDVGLCAANN